MSLLPADAESIGGYALVDRLGSGGMGVVYLGRSASGRQVAVKVVHAQYALDEEFRARFRQEVAAARRVSGAFTAPSWTPIRTPNSRGWRRCTCQVARWPKAWPR